MSTIIKKSMKLYELTPMSMFEIDGQLLKLHHIDGMYSYCKDKEGKTIYLAAFTDVEIIKDS